MQSSGGYWFGREFLADSQGDFEDRTTLWVIAGIDTPAVGLNNRFHDHQTDSEATRFCRDERRKQLADEIRRQSRA